MRTTEVLFCSRPYLWLTMKAVIGKRLHSCCGNTAACFMLTAPLLFQNRPSQPPVVKADAAIIWHQSGDLTSHGLMSTAPLLFDSGPTVNPIGIASSTVKRSGGREKCGWAGSIEFLATILLLEDRPSILPMIILRVAIEGWQFRTGHLCMVTAPGLFVWRPTMFPVAEASLTIIVHRASGDTTHACSLTAKHSLLCWPCIDQSTTAIIGPRFFIFGHTAHLEVVATPTFLWLRPCKLPIRKCCVAVIRRTSRGLHTAPLSMSTTPVFFGIAPPILPVGGSCCAVERRRANTEVSTIIEARSSAGLNPNDHPIDKE